MTWFARHHRFLTFTLGAVGFIHELVRAGPERPFILTLCGTLMGLPFVLSADGWRSKRTNMEPEDSNDDERWSHLP